MAGALAMALRLLMPVMSRLFGDEVKAWIPYCTKQTILLAVRRLPENHRARFAEEWASHLVEIPGEAGRLAMALGCLAAAHQMAFLLRHREPICTYILRRSLDILGASLLLVLYSPLLVLVSIAIKLDCSGKSVLVSLPRAKESGEPFRLYKFRIKFRRAKSNSRGLKLSPLSEFLVRTSINELPQLVNILRGDISLLGALIGQ